MTTQAQYATVPKLGKVLISTANANRDGTGTMGTLLTAAPGALSGTRLDKIQIQATGDTTTGMVRFFLVKGIPGASIVTINFSTTTATVTTSVAHGLTTGDTVTVQNALPDNYNVVNASITVLSATTFSYVMSVAPTVNATSVGKYSIVKNGEIPQFWREFPVTATTVVARTISSITQVGTTATLTTSVAHGLTSGDTVYITGTTPAAYSGTFVITVTGATTFTYTMLSAPGVNASVVGVYSVVKATFNRVLYSQNATDSGYMPLVLPSGWQVRVSTNNAEQFSITTTFAGDLE